MSDPRPLPWRPPVAGLWLRPWYDRLATWSVARLHLPMSRAWAEAEGARGAPAERARAAAAAWEAGFFGPTAPPQSELARLERDRRRRAAAWMAQRLRRPGAAIAGAPAAFRIAGPEEASARYGVPSREPEPYPTVTAEVAASHALERGGQRISWLRFPAADGGTAWARLERPAGPLRGTLIALHGVCIETELWPTAVDYTAHALAAGWQVLSPEAPWHGRRRLAGTYGGEPLIARGPLGFLDFFALAIPELAVWTRWARGQGGEVAWSGVSLGALTAQKAAEAAQGWPAEARPDRLLLIATAAHLAQAILDGSLGRLLGLRARLRAAGWTEKELARWSPRLDPLGPCPLPPDRVGLVLGAADRLLPFGQGTALALRWGLPAERVTVRRQGHFTVSLGLLADPAPLRDLLA